MSGQRNLFWDVPDLVNQYLEEGRLGCILNINKLSNVTEALHKGSLTSLSEIWKGVLAYMIRTPFSVDSIETAWDFSSLRASSNWVWTWNSKFSTWQRKSWSSWSGVYLHEISTSSHSRFKEDSDSRLQLWNGANGGLCLDILKVLFKQAT